MTYPNYRKLIKVRLKIEESINTRKPLIFTYTKWDEYFPEERKVVFQRMYSKNNKLYAEGYCFKRRDSRTFRLDRFNEIKGFDYPVGDIPKPIIETKVPSDEVNAERVFSEFESKFKLERRETVRGAIVTFFVLSVIGGFIFMFIVVNSPGMWEKVFGEKDDYYATPSLITYREIKGRNKNYIQEINISINEGYRGYKILQKDSFYTIKGLKGRYDSLFDAIVKVNTLVFKNSTGINDDKILVLYIEADLDKNGTLSWEEIQSFQLKVNREFKYISNEVALRPDDFMKNGGGDCEDWALLTAGLLRFWDWKPYIGSLSFKDNYHAVTLVKVDELPFGFKGYHITSATLGDGKNLPEGIYTYIDYYRVGRLTRASGRKPELVRVEEPEICYGKAM